MACWNVLADCYISIPWEERKDKLQSVLEMTARRGTSLVLLQEVDHSEDFYRPLLNNLGYQVLFAQRPTKDDGCLIAFCDRELELQESETVDFNDLARITGKSADNHKRQTFLRNNIAIIACFRCRFDNSHLIVANTHHYWNPNFPEVKAGQVKYLLDRIFTFEKRMKCSVEPHIILGGDFNSLPDSEVYSLLVEPFACIEVDMCNLSNDLMSISTNTLLWRRYLLLSKYLHPRENNSSTDKAATPSFICDETLSKFCRWLRILGISCTMIKSSEVGFPHDHEREEVQCGNDDTVTTLSDSCEPGMSTKRISEKELLKVEKDRKKLAQNNMYYSKISELARAEGRILLTTNKQWQQRADVPENFLVNYSDLRSSIVELFRLYNIEVDETKFLTVCGTCVS